MGTVQFHTRQQPVTPHFSCMCSPARNMKSSLALIQVLILCNLHNSNAISDQVGSGDPLASPWRWAWYLGQDFKDNLVSCPEQCGPGGLCLKEGIPREGECFYCGEGYGHAHPRCEKLEACDEECGKGGLCFKKLGREFCETCGEGMKHLESRRCTKLEPCDEQCGAGAKCYTYEGRRICNSCGEGFWNTFSISDAPVPDRIGALCRPHCLWIGRTRMC